MHHLFARSRTLRIKLTFGFSVSNVISISPLPAVLDYGSALSDFHGVSRAKGPTQLIWMSAIRKLALASRFAISITFEDFSLPPADRLG